MENRIVLMGFYIPDLHHIGHGSCGSHSVRISVASTLKVFLILIKHCPRLISQTKPSKCLNERTALSVFPFSSSSHLVVVFFFFFAHLSTASPLSLLVFKEKWEWAVKVHKYSVLFFSPIFCIFFPTSTQLSVLESVEGASHSAAVSWPVSSLSNTVVNEAKSR